MNILAAGLVLTVCGASLATAGHPVFACLMLVWVGGFDIGCWFSMWAYRKARAGGAS